MKIIESIYDNLASVRKRVQDLYYTCISSRRVVQMVQQSSVEKWKKRMESEIFMLNKHSGSVAQIFLRFEFHVDKSSPALGQLKVVVVPHHRSQSLHA